MFSSDKSENKAVAAEQGAAVPPTISLPKGGGAIRGIGEKFSANPVTGTGSLSVPIFTSPGRSNFHPSLSLSYDSGSGNGPFGVGWNLSIPTIARRTDKGLPQYRDADESDVYILSGAEDLVPVLHPDGTRFTDDTTAPGYIIHRYRPRIEGLFARIERWTNIETGEIHWRSITRDNVITLYGKDNNSRIFDPAELDKEEPANLEKAHPSRIFIRWHFSHQHSMRFLDRCCRLHTFGVLEPLRYLGLFTVSHIQAAAPESQRYNERQLKCGQPSHLTP